MRKAKETRSTVDLAAHAYNAIADRHGWSRATRHSAGRISKIMARVSDAGGLDGWALAMKMAGASDFLTGKTGRTNGHESWAPNLDFFLKPDKFNRLMEGGYNGNRTNAYSARRAADRSAIARALGLEWVDGDHAAPDDLHAPDADHGADAS